MENVFVVYLFRKLCTRFHQNRLSFIEDVKKNSLVSFSPDTVYSMSQKSSLIKLFFNFFTYAKYISIIFCQFVTNIYPRETAKIAISALKEFFKSIKN